MLKTMLPSLLALRAFECVARNKSFKNASDELCVTPGALSQLVRKLEDDLDVNLLLRKHRKIELTSQGEIQFVVSTRFCFKPNRC